MFDRDDNPCDACPWPCAGCDDTLPEDFGLAIDLPLPCPSCFGLGNPLGVLGDTDWYRCQDCGTDFTASEAEPEHEDACSSCHGTGEGRADGSRCGACGGSGCAEDFAPSDADAARAYMARARAAFGYFLGGRDRD